MLFMGDEADCDLLDDLLTHFVDDGFEMKQTAEWFDAHFDGSDSESRSHARSVVCKCLSSAIS